MKCVHWLAVATLAACLAGCGSKGAFPTAETTGIVLCEGQPVPDAEVYFEPLESAGGSSALIGKQGFAFSGPEGRFVLSTYGVNDGAVVGKHRVRVGGDPRKCECLLNSEVDVMEVEIEEGKINDFEIVLTKKTGREPVNLGDYEDDE
jgi:hypothetical protein